MVVTLGNVGLYDLVVFLLIFSVSYGFMRRFKFFDSSDIPALIALAISLVALTSSFFVSFIATFMPYVLFILVFIFLIILLLSVALVPQESITSYLRKSTVVPGLVVMMMFIFGLIAFGTVSSQQTGASGSYSVSATNTTVTSTFPTDLTGQYIISIFTNTTFLSMILTLLAMTLAVFAMTREKAH